MPKVSVVVPIFGVEKYIERCARSILEQTLDDMEYIFVDDCTCDRSIEILEKVIAEYPARAKQIKIIHHTENKGLPQARMTGVLAATGDYIAHCDSDDWVDLTMYQKIYEFAVENDSDLVLCDFIISDGINSNKDHVFRKNIKSTCREDLLTVLLTSYTINTVWSALISRDIALDIKYPVGAMSEDKTIMIQSVWKSRNVSYLDIPLYYYRLSETSIIRTNNLEAAKKKFRQITDNRYLILSFFEENGIVVKKRLLECFTFFSKTDILEQYLDDEECCGLFQNTFPISLFRVLTNGYIPLRKKVKYVRALWELRLLSWRN